MDKLDEFVVALGGEPKPETTRAKIRPPRETVPVESEVPIDPGLSKDDFNTVLYAEIQRKGIAGDNLASANHLYERGIKDILTKTFKIEVPYLKNLRDKTDEDRAIDSIGFTVEFTDVKMYLPTVVNRETGESSMMTPNMTRLRSITYSGPMEIDATIRAVATLKDGGKIERTERIQNFRIASIPVMLRSRLCNTYGASRETLKELQEDPTNPGGYYIVNGGEWAVDNLESILINGFHVYKNVYQNEVCRGEFISKPGDSYENSFYSIIRLLKNGAVTVQITFNKNEKFDIPFYILFRVFGIVRDDEIVDHIVYGRTNGDTVTREMVAILAKAMTLADKTFEKLIRVTDPARIIEVLGGKMLDVAGTAYTRDENAIKYVNNATYARLDKYIFPHMGLDSNSRVRKMRFMGHLINTLLRVHLGVLEPTDRDSYRNKRVHGPGVSLAKAFKTQVNFIIVHEIRKHLTKDFRSTPFRQVPLADSVKAAVNTQELERVLVQVITSGNRTITVKRNEVTNRVSSQTVYHKNDLNLKSILNTINSANSATSRSKSTDRADQMRRVHSSFIGFISVAQSADTGEKVGVSKQKGPWVSITEASSSEALKMALHDDPEFIPLDDVPLPAEISSRKLTKVFVNGDWIGFCENGAKFIAYYRSLRRMDRIHPYTTMVWEPLVRNVYFWVDVGRLIRPVVIVYNNLDEYVAEYRKNPQTKAKFTQWTKLTRNNINELRAGTMTTEDLRKARIIEYISPEEQENALIAPSYRDLLNARHDITTQYTHCDIEVSIFGIVELSAPNINRNPSSRVTMATNHLRQACGWAILSYPHRIDKNVFIQYNCEVPIVKSFSTPLVSPNGMNLLIAYMCHSGQNMEDSAIVNKSSVDRGLFSGCMFRSEKAELEKGEQFGNPDYTKTTDIKKSANYGYIENGFIREGTVVKTGDVLIVKTGTIAQPTDEYQYVDKSIVYKHLDPAIVERVVITYNSEDKNIAKVKLRAPRPLGVGDKLCLTPDHEVLTPAGWLRIDEVTTNHRVYTVNFDGKAWFEHPSETHRYQHLGEMVETTYALMTPEHRVPVVEDGTLRLMPACRLVGATYRVLPGAELNDSGDYRESLKTAAMVAYGERIDGRVAVDHAANQWYDFRGIVIDGRTIFTDSTDLSRLPPRLDSKAVVSVYFAASDCVKIPEALRDDLCVHIARAGYGFIITTSTVTIIRDRTISMGPATFVTYEGSVHCVTVSTGMFLVRYRGRCHVTGNSSRNGNKAIVATLWPAEDMPYDENGITPDIIVNPHGIPSRMVVGQLIETLQALYACREGVFVESSPFRDIDVRHIMRELETKHGIKYGGHRRLYNGKTGNWIDTLVFVGPVGYQRLQKFVVDESYAVAIGPSSSLERQPLDGRSNEGGLRLGEMEGWVLASHSAMRVFGHKFYDHSDGVEMFVCRNCGLKAIVNEKLGLYKCKSCGPASSISLVNSSWVSQLLSHELHAMNIGFSTELEPLSFTKNME